MAPSERTARIGPASHGGPPDLTGEIDIDVRPEITCPAVFMPGLTWVMAEMFLLVWNGDPDTGGDHAENHQAGAEPYRS